MYRFLEFHKVSCRSKRNGVGRAAQDAQPYVMRGVLRHCYGSMLLDLNGFHMQATEVRTHRVQNSGFLEEDQSAFATVLRSTDAHIVSNFDNL